ncbi:MAG: hypothetical protein ABEN55_20085 [Bradymonadaceae bacterium]
MGRFLDKLAPSDVRDKWTTYARAERSAMKKGGRADQSPPSVATLAAAIRTTAWRRRHQGTFGAADRPAWWPYLRLYWVLPIGLVLGGLSGLLGFGAGRQVRQLGRFVPFFLPGTARSAHLLAPVVGTAFIASVLASLFSLDQLVMLITGASYGIMYGLDFPSHTIVFTPNRSWISAAFAIATILHGATTAWDILRDN